MCIYGPVASKELGRALKVCPTPAGTCTCSCVYCPHGVLDKVGGRRRSFHERNVLLERTLEVCRTARPDTVAFAGGGEPTLDRNLGWLIERTRAEADVRVAVVTNGTLLYRRDVRQDLARSDVVISSLNAGTEHLYLAVNRPHGSLDFDRVWDGLLQFRHKFEGELWLDVMLVENLNDGLDAMLEVRALIDRVEPDAVRVRVPDWPPAESWVLPPSPRVLERAVHMLGPTAKALVSTDESIETCAFSDANQAIRTICAQHPLRLTQATEIERSLRSPGTLQRMIDVGDLVRLEWQGEKFLRLGAAESGRFAKEARNWTPAHSSREGG